MKRLAAVPGRAVQRSDVELNEGGAVSIQGGGEGDGFFLERDRGREASMWVQRSGGKAGEAGDKARGSSTWARGS